MENSLEALFGGIIKLSSAQRMAILDAAAQVAADRGDSELASHVERAQAHEANVRDLERDQQSGAASQAVYPPEMKPLDDRLDRSLTGLRSIVYGYMYGDESDAETQELGGQLLDGIFPSGVAAIIRLPYRDQAVATQDIASKLANEFADHVAFFGLTRKVANLNALSAEYSATLERGRDDVTVAEVRSAQQRGHLYMLEVLARVIGMAFDSNNPDHVADRERVLDVLFAQIAQTRARRIARRRRNQPGVDTCENPAQASAAS